MEERGISRQRRGYSTFSDPSVGIINISILVDKETGCRAGKMKLMVNGDQVRDTYYML